MVFVPMLDKDHIILYRLPPVFGHRHTIDIAALCLHGQCLVTPLAHRAVSEYGSLCIRLFAQHDYLQPIGFSLLQHLATIEHHQSGRLSVRGRKRA